MTPETVLEMNICLFVCVYVQLLHWLSYPESPQEVLHFCSRWWIHSYELVVRTPWNLSLRVTNLKFRPKNWTVEFCIVYISVCWLFMQHAVFRLRELRKKNYFELGFCICRAYFKIIQKACYSFCQLGRRNKSYYTKLRAFRITLGFCSVNCWFMSSALYVRCVRLVSYNWLILCLRCVGYSLFIFCRPLSFNCAVNLFEV